MSTLVPDRVYGCLISTGKTDAFGYVYHGRTRAHIVAYAAVHGPVPDGHQVDHLCRRRACCAPHHLEAVTPSENGYRKAWAYRARRVSCRAGHRLEVHGMVTPERGRVCRRCGQDAGVIPTGPTAPR